MSIKDGRIRLTGNAGKQLLRKMLYLAARKGCESIPFQEIKDRLPKQVRDNADVIPKVKTFPQMYTLVPIMSIILTECL